MKCEKPKDVTRRRGKRFAHTSRCPNGDRRSRFARYNREETGRASDCYGPGRFAERALGRHLRQSRERALQPRTRTISRACTPYANATAEGDLVQAVVAKVIKNHLCKRTD